MPEVWVGSAAGWQAHAATLSADEQARAARKAPAHRDRWVAAHALLRHVLGHHLGTAPSEVVFAPLLCAGCGSDQHGKPRVAGIEFNLSHSGDHVAVAVHPDEPVGVDVETTPPRRPDDLAGRFFAPEERARSGDPDEFLRLWARKEAVLKLLGTGLAGALDVPVLDDHLVLPDGVAVTVLDVAHDGPGACAVAVLGHGPVEVVVRRLPQP